MRIIFFWKYWKFNEIRKMQKKIQKKRFCFWDKSIWIVFIQLSLLIREYMSSAVNFLKKRLKSAHVSKSDFCNSFTFKVVTQDYRGALIKIESVLRPVYHVGCPRVLLNETFYAFILGRLPWSLISEKTKRWGSFFLKTFEI